MNEESKFSNIKYFFNKIKSQYGWKGFYRGLIPNLLKSFPASLSSFYVYEKVEDYLEGDN